MDNVNIKDMKTDYTHMRALKTTKVKAHIKAKKRDLSLIQYLELIVDKDQPQAVKTAPKGVKE